MQSGFRVAAIGPEVDLSFPVEMLGDGGEALNTVVAGEHPWAERLFGATAPMLVLGQGALARPDGARVLGAGRAIAEIIGKVRPDWKGFNVLHRAAARVGGLDLGFLPAPGGREVAGLLPCCPFAAIQRPSFPPPPHPS